MHDESEFEYTSSSMINGADDLLCVVSSSCEAMGINLILGERLDLGSIEKGEAKTNEAGQKIVRTVTGRKIAADLLVSLNTHVSE